MSCLARFRIANKFYHQQLLSKLQLKKRKSTTHISGIGQSEIVSNHMVDVVLKARNGEFHTNLTAVCAPTITENQPHHNISSSSFPIPPNIDLADPLVFQSQRIDILIGATHFFEFICVGQIHFGSNKPILQKTKLGWIISGGGKFQVQKSLCLTATKKSITASDSIEQILQAFWEVENNYETTKMFTKEELDCEAHFVNNHVRLDSGEYAVRLPIRNIENLGESYTMALNRFKSLERKLEKNLNIKSQYAAFIKEFIDLSHMSEVESLPKNIPVYFLPHHCVHKADSSTTKLRVVFDGSAASSSGLSLNQVLMAGPTIQPKLFNILIRFRTFPIALTADIAKMYHCVWVPSTDSYLQCILWRDNVDEPIRMYKLDTVTYGTKPASFLVISTMQQLAIDEGKGWPIGSEVVKNHFVDDMISGGNNQEGVLEVIRQSKSILQKGNFILRKWCSSSQNVLDHSNDGNEMRRKNY